MWYAVYNVESGNSLVSVGDSIGAGLTPDLTFVALAAQPAPGSTWNTSTLSFDAPIVQPAQYTAYNFLNVKLSQAQRVAMRTLAVTDTTAQDFIHMLDTAAACNVMVGVGDPNLIGGINYFASKLGWNAATVAAILS